MKKKGILTFHFLEEIFLNRVDIHLLNVKKFLTKMDILRLHMNKTLGICEINPIIRLLIL